MGLIAGAGIGAMANGAYGGVQALTGMEPPTFQDSEPEVSLAPLTVEDMPRVARAKARAQPLSPYFGSSASSSSPPPQRTPFGVNWVSVPPVVIDLSADDVDAETEDAEAPQRPAAPAAPAARRRVRRDRQGGFENIANRDVVAARATLAAMAPLPPRRHGRGPPLPDLPGT